jgi:DNA-binding transcriptional MerR regulator
MESHARTYTVRQVARLAGVTVRTLHHYDHIGLLTPSDRTAAGYRLYTGEDLLRLQQILFFRELDFPLEQVGEILADPAFDPVRALRSHRLMLQERIARLERLLTTVDGTIARLTEDTMGLTDEELYAGFSKEQAERYRREAREQYGAAVVEESERRARSMSKEQWQALGVEGDAVTRGLADLMERAPGDPDVQALIARHYAWVAHFWTPNAESYAGLGQLYVEHPEFRAHYEKYRAGLADFMQAAMMYYSEHSLK